MISDIPSIILVNIVTKPEAIKIKSKYDLAIKETLNRKKNNNVKI